MTTIGKKFKWMLWSPGEHFSATFDNFITSGFRVQLRGNMLELSLEASGTCSQDSAEALAEKYIEALRRYLGMRPYLMTEAEWLKRTTPQFGRMMTISSNREDRSHVARAVREARNELLASEDEELRRCYDLLQDAYERMNTPNDQGAYFAAYEAMEVLGEYFGNEKKAKAALGAIFKEAKTAANAKRHHRKKRQQLPQPSVVVVEMATKVIRNYERHVLDRL
jgi:hypothetical protein